MVDLINDALKAQKKYQSDIEKTQDKIENFDILETITNVGNDEVFTPKKVCDMMLDSLPEDVWHHPEYHWLNPCTKNGIFEREIALRLDQGLKDIISDELTRRKHILQEMIFSIGLTRFTSEVARRTLYYCNEANRKCDGIRGEDGHFVNGFAIGNGMWFDTEEGNIKTPTADHSFKKDRCEFCGIPSDSKYVKDPIQNEKYAYEFIHHTPEDLKKYLADKFFGGNQNMHFDIIIGNPPYQLADGGNGASAKPIYQEFVLQAIGLKPHYLSMIIPSRWFSGGKGLDYFRNSFLNDEHVKEIVDFPDSANCFPNVIIAGGVMYFVWEAEHKGNCIVKNFANGKIVSQKKRPLNEFSFFLRNNDAVSLIEKIQSKGIKFIKDSVFPRNYFGIPTTVTGEKKPFNGAYKCYSSKGIVYIPKEKVQDSQIVIDKYKVIITYAMSGGNKPTSNGNYQIVSSLRILLPKEVCSETYLILGVFDDKQKAENFVSYIKTKFFRFCMLQSLSSFHITKDSFTFVPDMDLNQSWNDSKLIKFFSLDSNDEMLINSLIKEFCDDSNL